MEKRIDSKIIVMIILLITVIGLSIGYATFSSTLTIKPSATYVSNPNNFKVDFSSSNNSLRTDPIVPVGTPSNVSATEAKILNVPGAKAISGLSAGFTEPGQKVEYTFYILNTGELEAFLKNIIFKNALNSTSNKLCEAMPGTTVSLVNEACKDINLKVRVGNDLEVLKSLTNITSHNLVKGAHEKVTVIIEYNSNGARADGDFKVSFGEIAIDYSSTDKVN